MGNSPSKNDALPTTSSSSSSGQTLASSASSGTGDLEPDESAPALSQFNHNNKSRRHKSPFRGGDDSGGHSSTKSNGGFISISNTIPIPNNKSHPKNDENYIKIDKTNTEPGSSPKRIPRNNKNSNNNYSDAKAKPTKISSSDADLDLEINLSMARLLTSSNNNNNNSNNLAIPDCSFSLESSSSTLASPVFTTLETKDEEASVSSFGSASSPTVSVNGTITHPKSAADATINHPIDSNDPFGSLEPIVERSLESTPEPRRPASAIRQPSLSRQAVSSKAKAMAKADLATEVVRSTSSTSSSSSSSPPLIPTATSKKSDVDVDSIIDRLLEVGLKKPLSSSSSSARRNKDKLPLSGPEIKYVLSKSRSIFLDQPTMLRLSPPVKIVGDIHGQFHDLIRIFNSCGYPPYTNYLFLGDYVDRGHKSLETMLLLLCYKIKYPENFFMLRGNHESANITKIYGFYDECKRRLPSITGSHKFWKNFVDVFNSLPIAATINDKIFCIHGGLSPDLNNLKQIEQIKRPTDIPDKGLLADLLWSDPDPSIKSFSLGNWPKNDRGVSYCFGKKHVDHFLSKFNMDLIVRGHMVVEDGYEFFNKRRLVTIFSAPNYCGEFNNFGAVMSVDKSLCCSFELLKPQ